MKNRDSLVKNVQIVKEEFRVQGTGYWTLNPVPCCQYPVPYVVWYITNMKKLLLALAIPLLLTGCFGSTATPTTTPSTTGFTSYANDEFKLQVPNDWETLMPINFKSEVPTNTVVAFRNNIRDPKFTANVAIIKNTLSQTVATLDYAKALYQKTSDEVTSFKEILTEEMNIMVAGKETRTILHVLEGREAPDKDSKRFFQITGVKGKTAFIAIGSMLATDTDVTAKKLEAMVRSFEVK